MATAETALIVRPMSPRDAHGVVVQKPLTPRERIKLWMAPTNWFETGLEVAEKAANPALMLALCKLGAQHGRGERETQHLDLFSCIPVLRKHGVVTDATDFLGRPTVKLTDYAKDALLGRTVARKGVVIQ